MVHVPTPEELRSRAASIFQQLRGAHPPAGGEEGQAGEGRERADDDSGAAEPDFDEAAVGAAEHEAGPSGAEVEPVPEIAADATVGAPTGGVPATPSGAEDRVGAEDAEDAEDAALAAPGGIGQSRDEGPGPPAE